MPTWKVSLTDEARNDLREVDGRPRILVVKQLAKLERDPHIGKHLGNKMGMDLTGYYKLYADGKRLKRGGRRSHSSSICPWDKGDGPVLHELRKHQAIGSRLQLDRNA